MPWFAGPTTIAWLVLDDFLEDWEEMFRNNEYFKYM